MKQKQFNQLSYIQKLEVAIYYLRTFSFEETKKKLSTDANLAVILEKLLTEQGIFDNNYGELIHYDNEIGEKIDYVNGEWIWLYSHQIDKFINDRLTYSTLSKPVNISLPTNRDIVKAYQDYDKSCYYACTSGDNPSKHFRTGVKWLLGKILELNKKN